MLEIIERPWTKTSEEIFEKMDVSAESGLTDQEVINRREKHGLNRLKEKQKTSVWSIFVDQFKNVIMLLLTIAGIVSFLFGDWIEGVAILFAVIINTAIGFFTELGARRSITALKQLSKVTAKVNRNSNISEIPAQDLVPGDIVVFEAGDIVTADIRIFEASKLKVNESALTGESVPVNKSSDQIEEDASLAQRSNMLFKGTSLTQGSAKGIVVKTGMNTELGNISSLVEEAQEEQDTPLEQRLNQLGTKLIWLTVSVAVLIVIVGLISGREIFLTVKTAIALMVAAIPEGLPIVATIALARGMWRMARRNCIINKLSAVETLGSTTLICTDKTGTLTENQMKVANYQFKKNLISIKDKDSINPEDNELLKTAIKIGALCNNASFNEQKKGIGDPMEVALLESAGNAKLLRSKLIDSMPELREVSFDSKIKMMATFHADDEEILVAVKGAPEAVFEKCAHVFDENMEAYKFDEEEQQNWNQFNKNMAENGLRVLALATKKENNKDVDPYENLTLVGLVGLADPPRPEIRESIDGCQSAGIRVIMITGDQPTTAKYIGLKTGLIDDEESIVIKGRDLKNESELTRAEKDKILSCNIFARVSPKHKLDLISLHQNENAIVAMTGDGVNDAPALKKANIGIAMGQRGTQVAKEAADMILKDDAFKTIVAAIEQGRAIFENIRKFIVFLLSGNMSEILVVAVSMLLGWPLPLLPLQILYLNMIGDVFPALALGIGKGDSSYMKESPKNPQESIVTKKHWLEIIGFGIWIAVVVMFTFYLSLQWLQCSEAEAVTIAFLTLAFSRILLVFNMKKQGDPVLKNEITSNPFIWGALILCVGLILLAVYIPALAEILKLSISDFRSWLLIVSMSLISLIMGQIFKTLKIKK